MSDGQAPTPERPGLRVVKGEPTAEELAALVAVVSARATRTPSRDKAGKQGTAEGWAAYWRAVRHPIHPGPGAWRASALPR